LKSVFQFLTNLNQLISALLIPKAKPAVTDRKQKY